MTENQGTKWDWAFAAPLLLQWLGVLGVWELCPFLQGLSAHRPMPLSFTHWMPFAGDVLWGRLL